MNNNVRPLDHFTFMDKNKAAALIGQHRRSWRSIESDYAIARRAEHVYSNVAWIMSVISLYWASRTSGSLLFHGVMAVLTLAFAGFCFWRSRRFMEIRQKFEDSWPQNISDLDAKRDSRSAA